MREKMVPHLMPPNNTLFNATSVKFKHLICSPLHILRVNTYVYFIAKIMNNKHIVILSMSWPPSSTNYSFSVIFVHQVGSYSHYAPFSKLFQWMILLFCFIKPFSLHARMFILVLFLLNIHIQLTLNKMYFFINFCEISNQNFRHGSSCTPTLTHCPCKYFVSP